MDPTAHATLDIDTPIGRYRCVATAAGILRLAPACGPAPSDAGDSAARAALDQASAALDAYFAGLLDALETLPVATIASCVGGPFERRVWRALRELRAGERVSYGEIARRVDRPGAARAVGSANRRNPVTLVIPCHRVVGSDGRPRGYSAGLARQAWLLAHEARAASRPDRSVPEARRLARRDQGEAQAASSSSAARATGSAAARRRVSAFASI